MTKLEEIARALIPDAWHETPRADGSKYYTLACADEEQRRSLRYARAAVEAMRKPTDAMCQAADDSDALSWSLERGEGLDGVSWARAYDAMISTILAEKP